MTTTETAAAAEEAFALRTYLNVLQRRWRVIAAVVVSAVVVALGLSLRQEKQYQVWSDVLLRSVSTATVESSTDAYLQTFAANRMLANDVKALESGTTIDAVAARYDGPLDPEDVSASFEPSSSDVVTLKLTANDAEEAAKLVNLYVETFIDLQRTDRIAELNRTTTEIQSRIAELRERRDALRAPLTQVEEQLGRSPGNDALESRRNDLTIALDPQLKPLEQQISSYEAIAGDLSVTGRLLAAGGPKLLTAAEPNDDPVAPKPITAGLTALIVGSLFGVFIAFVRDSLDERIRGMVDLERAAPGVPVMAGIPEIRGDQPDSFVAVRDDGKSMAAEGFRTLRTSVKFAALDDPIRVLQVTSALPGEGKTTAVANLAEAFAQGGERVAIVCCDLRRPRIQKRFGQGLGPGFTDVLLNEVSLADGLRRVHDRLYLLPAGSPPPNPSELLSSGRAAAVIGALAAEFDIVLIDSTPVLPVSDALVVSRLADATLVVVDARTTKRRMLRQTMQRLTQVSAPVAGMVLNGIGAGSSAYAYTYGYAYGYGAEETSPIEKRLPVLARRD